MSESVIIIGAGGHAKVIADIVLKNGDTLLGFLDDSKINKNIVGFPVLGKVEDIEQYKDKANFIIGIGNNYIRQSIAEKNNVSWHTAIHPSAQIGLDVNVGEGTVVMANTVINSSAYIGNHCIINTGAIVEHDNIIEDYVHISPNATLCGTVYIGELTHIGAGVTIKNNIRICPDVVVGAGGVVVKDINKNGTYIGVPVRRAEK